MTPELKAKEIKQLAERLGGYEQLAVRCDVRHQTVYKWVKGAKPHKVHLKTMQRIIEELDRATE